MIFSVMQEFQGTFLVNLFMIWPVTTIYKVPGNLPKLLHSMFPQIAWENKMKQYVRWGLNWDFGKTEEYGFLSVREVKTQKTQFMAK